MADIQMCTAVNKDGRVCHVAHKCYRNMADPSMMQAWGPPAGDFDPKDGCDNYWPMVDK